MARRNALEYGKALRKLTDKLVEIPKAQLHAVVAMLIQYWKEQHMEEGYPSFAKACKEIEDSL